MTPKIALVGNPNSGKSTLFNTLTSGRQRTGNWSGITVEHKVGTIHHGPVTVDIVDLPGLYSLECSNDDEKLDEQVSRTYIKQEQVDVIINVVDATTLARGLYLTTELNELGTPMLIAVTMSDTAQKQNREIDYAKLSERLGCPVVSMDARNSSSTDELLTALQQVLHASIPKNFKLDDRFRFVDQLVSEISVNTNNAQHISFHIDKWVLNRYLAIPIFLLVMYAMFFFSINVGSVLIDFFDILGGMLFVEAPRVLLQSINSPSWIIAVVADGIGGGIQLVGTFIPIIGALFLFQAVLEDSGYMGRIAFIVDRPLRAFGLPGRALVPLIVGFGCNVPSVMSTRSLDRRAERILTTIMVPFMSCGARLTVYVLFVAAFFPNHGQNVVFLLYLIGIVVALGTAWFLRNQLFRSSHSTFVQELPKYHLPNWRNLLKHTWHRLSDFVFRAGRAIVLVVVILKVVSSIGIDGSFGNENRENSLLASIGKSITPALAPMGIEKENWPATVGIFAGFFAKEVLVGTLDALYTPDDDPETHYRFDEAAVSALVSVPNNLLALGSTLLDPLGLSKPDLQTLSERAAANDVEISTIQAMQALFHGQLGAFSYLLFILLYVPCVATVGVILRELNGYWATFSVVWSMTIAYSIAVCVYQLGQLSLNPIEATIWILGMLVVSAGGMLLLTWWMGRAPQPGARLLAVKHLD